MKYLRRQNLNLNNVLDDTITQLSDGNIELNPTQRVVINGDVIINGDGGAPGPEVTNVMYVTLDGNDDNTGFGEGPNQAKRSLKAACQAAQEGTTIFIRSGEYYEDNPIQVPPKVSIIGDNLRRVIVRPLNGPETFTIASIKKISQRVTVTLNEKHGLELYERVRVRCDSNTAINDEATVLEIPNEYTFIFRQSGIDIALEVGTGTVKWAPDLFLVNSQDYLAGMVFKGLAAPAYCINIDKDAIVDTSPYVQNCSNINGPWMKNGVEWLPFITEQPDLNGTMVTGARPLRDDEIDPSQLDQYSIDIEGAGGGMLIDGDRYSSESPIKSMVGDAFTQVSQGGIGFHITNFGYMQLVSCFAVFCDKAFYTTKGGYLSISNSVIDFGNQGFVADGYYPDPYASGLITTDYYSTVGSVTVNSAGSGYLGTTPTATIESPTIPGGIPASVTVSVDPILGTVNAITVYDPGYGYDFQPTITIDPPVGLTINWTALGSVSLGDYIRSDNSIYEVIVAGTLGTESPTHTSGFASNGDVTLEFVGSVAVATVNLSKNLSIDVSNLPNKPQIGSILFLGDDPLGYYVLETSEPTFTFKYDEQKCRRDVGIILDAVMTDVLFDSNHQSTYAGLSYLRSYSSKVTSLQKSQTIFGLQAARDSAEALASSPTIAAKIVDNFNIVIDIINFGLSSLPVPQVPEPANPLPGYYQAAQILQANKSFIADDIIAWVNNFDPTFTYDTVKCSRDVGLIVNAVLDDAILGSNYRSITAGLSYLRSYASTVTAQQREQTIDGINKAKSLVLNLISNPELEDVVVANFKIVTNIIEDVNTSSVPPLRYTTSLGAGQINNAAKILQANKDFLKSEIVTWINKQIEDSTSPFTASFSYNAATCARDVGYIIDALTYDLLYGGNSQTLQAASTYYNLSVSLILGQEVQSVAAFNRLKELISDIVQNILITPTEGNLLSQNTSLPVGSLSAGATLEDLITLLNDIVEDGTTTVSEEVPTYSDGFYYAEWNSSRTDVIAAEEDVKSATIAYLNSKYSIPFSEETCRRDIGYIIDALAYDLTYGGNTQTTNAALAYGDGSVITGEVEKTKSSYVYWQSIVSNIVKNIPVDTETTGQDLLQILGSPADPDGPANKAEALIQIIIDVLDHGPGYITDPVEFPDYNRGLEALVLERETILESTAVIQETTITSINTVYGGVATVTTFPPILTVLANTEAKFHNVSTVSTGGTALEYVGAGVTYNALPFFGGEPIPANERVEINNGKCFTVSNDQIGNYKIGEFFTVNALSGEVTINAENLNLAGLGAIGPFKRNGIPVGVELREISNNSNLISSTGSPDPNTVPTQPAVQTYVENRYLNKVASAAQTVESDVAFIGDVEVRGADLTTDQSNFNLLNTTATTVNAFGDATSISIGDTSGTTNFKHNVDIDLDLNVDGDITTNLSTFNLLNTTATTVNAFGDATSISIGNSAGLLTINNDKVIFDSVTSLQIPVGDVSQRPTPTATGQIRYNSELSTFEGFGPGNAWGSLGGVRSVDGLTQITAESAPGASDDILRFYAADIDNITSKLTVTINNESLVVLNTTQSVDKDTGALIVEGGVGIEKTVQVGESVYVGDKVGFADATGVSIVYQQYNADTDSLDTIFG